MKNKELQESRMRSYFIQATKEIIKGEGVKALSVRNVADRAGYSYATLYNYFKHINELIFHCVNDFQEEIREYVNDRRKSTKDHKADLIHSIERFIQFFVEYPGIFSLYYLNEMGDLGKNSTAELIYNSMEDACEQEFINFLEQSKCNEKQIQLFKDQLNSIIVGSLLFYLNRKKPDSFKEFKDGLNKMIHDLVKNACS